MADPEVSEDIEYQRRTWVMERLGWGVFVLILLAAVLGAFGTGIFGTATASSPTGTLQVEYSRFMRQESPEVVRVRFDQSPAADGTLRIWFSRDYIDRLRVEQVMPPPVTVTLGTDRVTYVFASDGAPGPRLARFWFEATAAGLVRGEVGMGVEAVSVRHLIYP